MNALRYLVDSKRGLVWCKVGDDDWFLEANVKEKPQLYFKTLKGIFYMRQYPEDAIQLFESNKVQKDDYDDYDIDNFNESFSRN